MYQQLKSYMEREGISQSHAAKALGVSKPALNSYLQHKYAGDVAAIDAKVQAYLKLQQERRETAKLDMVFVETKTAKQMLSFLGLAHVLGQLGIVYGGAGVGKTTALKEYQRRNPSSVLIEPDTGYTAKVLLQEICRALGQNDKGNIHDMTERIADTLRGSGRMLMIDEAELLPMRALESIRRIHDKADCAVMLVGMPKLLLNLKGPNAEFKQLFSRVSVRLDMGVNIDETDLRHIAGEVLGVKDETVLTKLTQTAQGNVRKLAKLMMIVRYLMQVNQVPIDHLDAAFVERADSYLIH